MKKCKFCKELNEEKCDISIEGIYIHPVGHYNYSCDIKYCPNCGTILDKYKNQNKVVK